MTRRRQPGLFVTGTDTGVGKTFVAAAIARRLRSMGCAVGVMKPVETGLPAGSDDNSDAERLKAAAGIHNEPDLISPYRFALPIAPLAAARAARQTIEQARVLDCYRQLAERHDVMVVEGAGGLLVPTGPTWDMRDLILWMGLPVVLVGRAGLGGINHALLSLEALSARKAPVLALLLNETEAAENPLQREQVATTVQLLRERTSAPVLGPLPYQSDGGGDWLERVDRLALDQAITEIAASVWPEHAERPEPPHPRQAP